MQSWTKGNIKLRNAKNSDGAEHHNSKPHKLPEIHFKLSALLLAEAVEVFGGSQIKPTICDCDGTVDGIFTEIIRADNSKFLRVDCDDA